MGVHGHMHGAIPEDPSHSTRKIQHTRSRKLTLAYKLQTHRRLKPTPCHDLKLRQKQLAGQCGALTMGATKFAFPKQQSSTIPNVKQGHSEVAGGPPARVHDDRCATPSLSSCKHTCFWRCMKPHHEPNPLSETLA